MDIPPYDSLGRCRAYKVDMPSAAIGAAYRPLGGLPSIVGRRAASYRTREDKRMKTIVSLYGESSYKQSVKIGKIPSQLACKGRGIMGYMTLPKDSRRLST